MNTTAWIILAAVLAVAAGSICVCLAVQRHEPAGMPHVVREGFAAVLRHLLGATTPSKTRKHRRTA